MPVGAGSNGGACSAFISLALSKHLIENMGGTIGVETTDRNGSIFWIELAMTAEREPALEDQSTRSRDPALVLYIENNLSNFEFVKNILVRRPEVRLLPARQGGPGVALARQHRPHLILLNAHLSDVSGIEVLRRLGETPETRELPVVVFGDDASPTQIERLHAAGARAYLTTPLDVKKFLGVLDELIKESKTRHAVGQR